MSRPLRIEYHDLIEDKAKDSQKNNLDFLLDCEQLLSVTKIFI